MHGILIYAFMALENFITGSITDADSYHFTIPEILKIRAEQTPDETAYIFLRDGDEDEERITNGELYRLSVSIAASVIQTGNAGAPALMLFAPGLDFITSLYACFYAGVVAVPAYPPRKNRSLERIRVLVADSGAGIVLTTSDIYQTFERSFSDLEELKKLTWICVDRTEQIADLNEFRMNHPDPASVALLQYTSGSTGQPKGVMVKHVNITRNLEFIRRSFSLSRKTVSVTWLPSFHDMGLIDGVIGPVYNGYPGVIIPPVAFIQKPVRWLRAITRYRGTHAGGPNFAFDHCVEAIAPEEREGLDLSSIDTLYCGAEPIRKTTFDRLVEIYADYGFRPGMLYPCYGMAETTLIISGPEAGRGAVNLCVSGNALEKNQVKIAQENEPDARHLVGVGHAWIDTEICITDPENHHRCSNDVVGEIWVKGSIVTAGYWNKPEQTGETFAAQLKGGSGEPWMRTGDLGFIHNGELYITGRLKDLIILQGRNYYPQDIEYVAENSHPALRANASAAFPVEIGEAERLVIVAEVERSALRDLNTEEVCSAIRQQVAEEFEQEVYAIQLLRTASILKTSSGKIQRKACRSGFLEKTLQVAGESFLSETTQPEVPGQNLDITTLQAWLMAWIHINLKVPFDRIDLLKPISVYGLNSMKAVQLQQDVLDRYRVNVPPYVFFDRITVKELSERAFAKIEEGQ